MQPLAEIPDPIPPRWRWLEVLLLFASVSCLLAAFGLHREARFFESAPPLVGHGDVEEGTPIARLRLDRLGLETVVAEGSSQRVLRRSAGRMPATGRIVADGSVRGNVVIAAHRDTHFRPLQDVEPGDVLQLEGPDGVARYLVDWTRVVDPEAIWVTEQRGRDELTLVTCYPFRWIGPAPERFIVRARKLPSEN